MVTTVVQWKEWIPKDKKLLGLSSPAEICMVISAGKRADNGIYGKQIRFSSKYFIHEV